MLQGHEVVCLTRDTDRIAALQSVRPLRGDLTEPGHWQTDIASFAPDQCIHLAWQGLPGYSLALCRTNLDASLRLLETLAVAKVKRITVVGSCWEYGDVSGAVAEDYVGVNCGLFATTKTALRSILARVARDVSFEYRWARVFFAYGPGQRAQSLIRHCHAAYAAGREPDIRSPQVVQDFIHLDDVARGLWAVASHEGGSGIFNIGSGTPTTVGTIVNRIAANFGRPMPFPSLPLPTGFWADTTRTTQATGWSAEITVADGLAQSLAILDRMQ